MTTGILSGLTSRFRAVLRRHLRYVEDGDTLDMEADLRDLGLDSVDAINLLIELEVTLGVVFPDSLLTVETFRTGATLERAVMSLAGR